MAIWPQGHRMVSLTCKIFIFSLLYLPHRAGQGCLSISLPFKTPAGLFSHLLHSQFCMLFSFLLEEFSIFPRLRLPEELALIHLVLSSISSNNASFSVSGFVKPHLYILQPLNRKSIVLNNAHQLIHSLIWFDNGRMGVTNSSVNDTEISLSFMNI